MKNVFTTLALISFLVPALAPAAGKPAKGPDAQAIDSACAADGATAGCTGEQVGTGLLKCLHAYKKAHKDFKFSDGCRAAVEKARADRKAKKE